MSEPFEIITNDKLILRGNQWVIDQPVAWIILIHGFGEHIGRYQHVADYLVDNHFNVMAIDLRGHGKSDGRRGHTPSFDRLVDDMNLLVQHVSENSAELPLILYGHSMGGNLSANYILRCEKHPFKMAILTSPWLRLQFKPPSWQVIMGQLMRKIWPSFSQSNNLNPDDLSTDLAIGKAYESDPLVNDKITTEMFFSITEAGEWAIKHGPEFNIPLLIMHGEEDAITSPSASREFADAAKAEYKLCPNMRHEIHNEIGKEKILHTTVQWITTQLADRP